MSLSADLAGLMRALEESKVNDWGLILIAADAAAEAEDWALEAGLRWCAKNQKWPRRIHPSGMFAGSWHWDPAWRSGPARLPQNVDQWLGPGGYHDPDLTALIRRTGAGLIALEIIQPGGHDD